MEGILKKLKRSQLKKLAEKYGIETGELELKKDFVEALAKNPLITSAEVENFLANGDNKAPDPSPAKDAPIDIFDAAAGMDSNDAPEEPKAEIDEASPDPADESEELPKDATPAIDPEIERKLENAMSQDVPLDDVSNLLSKTKESYEKGDFKGTVDFAKQALDTFKRSSELLQTLGVSYAIMSSQRLISNGKEMGVDVKKAEGLLSEAKNHFDSDIARAGTLIDDLNEEAIKLHTDQGRKVGEMLASIEETMERVRDMGANTYDAEKLLSEAQRLLSSDFYMEALEQGTKAEETTDAAKTERIKELEDSIPNIEAIISEAEDLGSDVKAPKKLVSEARSLFKKKKYVKGAEKVQEAEKTAQELLQAQIQKAMELQNKMKSKVQAQQAATPASQPAASQEQGGFVDTGTGVSTQDAAPAKEASSDKPKCTGCSGELTWVEQYKRWYCYTCAKYA